MKEAVDQLFEPVDEMRGLIRVIHQGGYRDVGAMRRFITIYESYEDPGGKGEEFCRSLDSPDIGFEYWEGVFDKVVGAFFELGGSLD
jgi:hypothetical protein